MYIYLQVLNEKVQAESDWLYEGEEEMNVYMAYLIIFVLGMVLQSPAAILGDTGTLYNLGSDNLYAYGHQRALGSIGWALA